MKKGKYMDYTCLIACLSHKKMKPSKAVNELLSQVATNNEQLDRLIEQPISKIESLLSNNEMLTRA